jgi:hypothetical protein
VGASDSFKTPVGCRPYAPDFLRAQGRLLERRLFEHRYEGAPASGVLRALSGFRNDDGGFGHGLEPDKRCPASLPLDVEIALGVLDSAGIDDPATVHGACGYLASVATPEGAVPLALPIIEEYPRAEHMTDWTYRPDLNPTAGLVGLARRLGATHPWVDRATTWCWDALDRDMPTEAHAVGEVLIFLETAERAGETGAGGAGAGGAGAGGAGAGGAGAGGTRAGERDRAAALAATVPELLGRITLFRADPADPAYGVTPLHYAPTPDSRWRGLFTDAQIEGHLDRLERDQQADGGWALSWEPPSQAATLEYRSMETLRALRVLTAYGRVTPA